MMSLVNRIYFSISVVLLASLVLFTLLWLAAHVEAEAMPTLGRVSVKKPLITALVPQKQNLTLVSSVPLLIDGEPIGVLLFYDDAATKRPVDYAEVYNTAGDLLAVHWFDGFGIERTAIDRGIILDEGDVEGTLVLLLDGDFI
jgi:hypothetical protein